MKTMGWGIGAGDAPPDHAVSGAVGPGAGCVWWQPVAAGQRWRRGEKKIKMG